MAAASFQVATQTVTVKTALAWLGHNYTNQANHPARFAAVLEHKMVTFFKGAGTDVMPPRGAPCDEVIGRTIGACQRRGIQMLDAA